MFNKAIKGLIFTAVVLGIQAAKASQFLCDGKECTKGQAVVGLAKGTVKTVVKVDTMMLDTEKGTLKIKK